MQALPIPFRPTLLVAFAAFGLLGLACGDDLPPGARELTEAERQAGSSSSGAPAEVEPPGPQGDGQATPRASGPAASAGADRPRVVAVDPPNGATGVDPSRTTLSVTFDRAMDREGWAWVIEDEATAPEVGEARFDPSGRTNTVQVELEPGRRYVLWVNSDQFQYFKSVAGVPAEPFRWTFRTAGAPAGGGDGGIGLISARENDSVQEAPQVVEFDPPNGATGVDPERETISVTFDRAMDGSWAWVTEGGTTPPPTRGEPSFSPDRRTNILPVDLAPETTYTIWINGEQYLHFRSVEGVPVEPVRWSFTTGPG